MTQSERPVALVTGGTGAIGKAIARQLAVEHGFRGGDRCPG